MSTVDTFSTFGLYDLIVWLSMVGLAMIPAAVVVLLVVVGGQWFVERVSDCLAAWRFHRRMRAIVRGGPGVRAVRLAVWKRWIHR